MHDANDEETSAGEFSPLLTAWFMWRAAILLALVLGLSVLGGCARPDPCRARLEAWDARLDPLGADPDAARAARLLGLLIEPECGGLLLGNPAGTRAGLERVQD